MTFNAEYLFDANRLVVIKHPKGNFLRVNTANNHELDEYGATGKYAQWNIELDGQQDGLKVVKLRHNLTGKYLRICDGGNKIDVAGGGGKWTRFKVHKTGSNKAKLESCEISGKYPAVQRRGPAIGTGGRWTEFTFFRLGDGPPQTQGRAAQTGGGPYQHHYHFAHNNQIVLCGYFGKYLRINPNNHSQADGNGGTGSLARWKVYLDGKQDEYTVAKFQNTKTGKYLRIYNSGKTLDVGGGGGKWTRFKVKATNNNSCKLESCELPGKYVAVQPRGVAIGTGGRYTEFSVWANQPPKNVVDNVQQVPIKSEHCFGASGQVNVDQCSYLLRLTSAVKRYSGPKRPKTDDNMYENLLNDYNHLIDVHGNHVDEICTQLVQNHKFEPCDITKCTLTTRHYNNDRRNKSNDNDEDHKSNDVEEETDSKLLFFQDIFDSIHHFLFHMFDVGLRIKKSEASPVNDHDDDDDVENNDRVDTRLLRMQNQIREKRQKLSTCERLNSTNNKFQIKTTIDVEKESDEKQSVGTGSSKPKSSFNIGLIFYYWPYYKDKKNEQESHMFWFGNINDHSGYSTNELYVPQKHATFKEEILQSGFIDMRTYDDVIMVKANAYITTEIAKSFIFNEGSLRKTVPLYYDIPHGTPLSLSNLISLIMYCDFSKLCTDFSSTFRPRFASESLSSIKSRNQKYWWLSKTLRETVQLYGSSGKDPNKNLKGPFYCGMTYMIIDNFKVRLCSPTSTSHQISVAIGFGGATGIVMQLNNTGDYWHSRYLRGFDCSWISAFHEEDERLFMGGDFTIRIESVIKMKNQQNFGVFFNPMFYFDSLVSGPRVEGTVKKRDKKVLALLIKYQIERNATGVKPKSKLDEYVFNAFHGFCHNKTQVGFNLQFISKFDGSNTTQLRDLILNPIVHTWDVNEAINIGIDALQNVPNETIFKLFPNMNRLIIRTSNFNGKVMYPLSLKSLLSVVESNTDPAKELSVVLWSKWCPQLKNSTSWLTNLWNSPSMNEDFETKKWTKSLKRGGQRMGKPFQGEVIILDRIPTK